MTGAALLEPALIHSAGEDDQRSPVFSGPGKDCGVWDSEFLSLRSTCLFHFSVGFLGFPQVVTLTKSTFFFFSSSSCWICCFPCDPCHLLLGLCAARACGPATQKAEAGGVLESRSLKPAHHMSSEKRNRKGSTNKKTVSPLLREID